MTGHMPAPPEGPPASREHPRGTMILILGILSIVALSVLGIPAWIMGRKANQEIQAAPPGTYSNAGLVKAGYICGIIGSILFILTVLALLAALIFFVAAS